MNPGLSLRPVLRRLVVALATAALWSASSQAAEPEPELVPDFDVPEPEPTPTPPPEKPYTIYFAGHRPDRAILPPNFWNATPGDAAREFVRLNARFRAADASVFLPPNPPDRAPPETGSAVVALRGDADKIEDAPRLTHGMLLVQWSPSGATLLSTSRGGPRLFSVRIEGAFPLDPARWIQLLRATEALAAIHPPSGPIAPPQRPDSLAVVLRAESGSGDWQLAVDGEIRILFRAGEPRHWDPQDAPALRATLAAELWLGPLIDQIPDESSLKAAYLGRRDARPAEQWVLRELEGSIEWRLDVPTFLFARHLATLLSERPSAENHALLARLGKFAVEGAASPRVAPEAERLAAVLVVAERRLRIAESPTEVARFALRAEDGNCADCAWANAFAEVAGAAFRAQLQAARLPSLRGEALASALTALHFDDEALARSMADSLQAKHPEGRALRTFVQLLDRSRAPEESRSRGPLITIALDHKLPAWVRVPAISRIQFDRLRGRSRDEFLNFAQGVLGQAELPEPVFEAALKLILKSGAARGTFAALRKHYLRVGNSPEIRQLALQAMAEDLPSASPASRTWFRELLRQQLRAGQDQALLPAWIADCWDLRSEVKTAPESWADPDAAECASQWLGMAQATGRSRVELSIPSLGLPPLRRRRGVRTTSPDSWPLDTSAIRVRWFWRTLDALPKAERIDAFEEAGKRGYLINRDPGALSFP